MSNIDSNSQNDTANTKLSQKRRALIKGSALAIPAVLTLRSGSALAATSIACNVKLQSTSPTDPTLEVAIEQQGSNPWLRQTTDIRIVALKSNPSSTLKIFKDPNSPPPPAPANWYNALYNTNTSAALFVESSTSGEMTNNGVAYTYTTTTSAYVLIQYDQNGNIIGYGAQGSSSWFPFSTASCMHSLHP